MYLHFLFHKISIHVAFFQSYNWLTLLQYFFLFWRQYSPGADKSKYFLFAISSAKHTAVLSVIYAIKNTLVLFKPELLIT